MDLFLIKYSCITYRADVHMFLKVICHIAFYKNEPLQNVWDLGKGLCRIHWPVNYTGPLNLINMITYA